MSKRWLYLLGTALGVVCGAGAVYLKNQQPLDVAGLPTTTTTDGDASDPVAWKIICTGRVETIRGDVDVCAQIAGLLAEVRVQDGDVVNAGDILAVVEGGRETAEVRVAEAAVELARARLKQVQAGNGQEEIDQAVFELQSVQALLDYETASLKRTRDLHAGKAITPEQLDQKTQRVAQLQRQRDSLRKRHEALVRGALPEEIAVARAELASAEQRLHRARVEDEYRFIRAPMTGTVVKVYRHGGDSVLIEQPCPIVRLTDPTGLRIRLEVDEADVPRFETGISGTFSVPGAPREIGQLSVQTIIPSFSPSRLFNPDASARQDNRILEVLCEPDSRLPLYPGQRVTAVFEMPPRES
jgi:multidrug resistance efflux pump